MKNIQPKYVTFEQAKLLKQKGFDIPCGYKWGLTEHAENSNDITIEGTVYSLYCHRDFGIYAIQIKNWNDELVYVGGEWVPIDAFSAPEQHQVVEWLRVNHGIWVESSLIKDFTYTPFKTFWYGRIINLNKEEADIHNTEEFNTPHEAYSVAFDYVLNNLI
jgi:hypothetical protein